MTRFEDLMKLAPADRANVYHSWAREARATDPELAQLFDTTAAELETLGV